MPFNTRLSETEETDEYNSATEMLTIMMSCRLVLNIRAPGPTVRGMERSSAPSGSSVPDSGAVLPPWAAMSTLRTDNKAQVDNRDFAGRSAYIMKETQVMRDIP